MILHLAVALATYLAFNLLVFLTFWRDKQAARNGEWRVRESTLLWLAFLGGSLGAIIAQRFLRHKTRKEPFRSILRAILVFQLAVIILLFAKPEWPMQLLGIAGRF